MSNTFLLTIIFGLFSFSLALIHDLFPFFPVASGCLLGLAFGKISMLRKELSRLQMTVSEKNTEQIVSKESFEKTSQPLLDPLQTTLDLTCVTHFTEKENLSSPTVELAIRASSREADLNHPLIPGVSESLSYSLIEDKNENRKQDPKKVVKPDHLETDNFLSEFIKNRLTGEFLFTRIGILILFLSVSFLLKYAVNQGWIPLEYRLLGVGLGALGLFSFALKIRKKKAIYSTLLQGTAVGILYLDIFVSFSVFDKLASFPALVFLFLISLIGTGSALLQNSKALAIISFGGGFLAPILVATGSYDQVSIFSYYAILNIAIVAIAWFRSWRSLNVLGFISTFLIGSCWGILHYTPEKLVFTEPFLILFFLFYVTIAYLFAFRRPSKIKSYVDGTLVLGTPIVSLSLQYLLVGETRYGFALSIFLMGSFYLILANYTLKHKFKKLKRLNQTYRILGIIFLSLSLPFVLSPHQSAAIWAIEEVLIVWLGTRQENHSTRLTGYLLQGGALLMYLSTASIFSDQITFFNLDFLSILIIGISLLATARILNKPFPGRKDFEKNMSLGFLSIGVIWLSAGLANQTFRIFGKEWIVNSSLLFSSLIGFISIYLAEKLKPNWKELYLIPQAILGYTMLIAVFRFLPGERFPSEKMGWLAWPTIIAMFYYFLSKYDLKKIPHDLFHGLVFFLSLVLITLETRWQIQHIMVKPGELLFLGSVLPSLCATGFIVLTPFSLMREKSDLYKKKIGFILACILAALISFTSTQSAEIFFTPIWLPVLNLMDVIVGLSIFGLVALSKSTGRDAFEELSNDEKAETKQIAGFIGLLFIFIWLNLTLFRGVHHWTNLPYSISLLDSDLVQTGLSILWAALGVIATVYGSSKKVRFIWFSGIALLGCVVVKLFLIDLSTLEGLQRIVSFFVVGVLLTSVGYFAPPPSTNTNSVSN